jgi:hypothetical protein
MVDGSLRYSFFVRDDQRKLIEKEAAGKRNLERFRQFKVFM